MRAIEDHWQRYTAPHENTSARIENTIESSAFRWEEAEPVPGDTASTGALLENEGQLNEARGEVSAQPDFTNDSLIT